MSGGRRWTNQNKGNYGDSGFHPSQQSWPGTPTLRQNDEQKQVLQAGTLTQNGV
jgi:hypothetical protein